MRVDPFTMRLDQLSYETLYEAFRDVGTETQRLEFKQQSDPETLARAAIAMANGNGGLIVVGFKDPDEGTPLVPFPFSDAIDEPARRRLLSRTQARVYPSLPLDAAAYTAADGSDKALVLRVDASDAAPHELLTDRGRFLIRRGTEITGMTLRELETMISRRNGLPHNVRFGAAPGRLSTISLDRSVEEGFVGLRLDPEVSAPRKPISRSRQLEIERFVLKLTGLNAVSTETQAQGILFLGPRPPADATVIDEARAERYRRRLYVGEDGHFEMRRPDVGQSYGPLVLSVLCNAYALGSQLFLALGIGPRARGELVCHRRSAQQGEATIADDGAFTFAVDFSTDTAVDLAREPLMYALRTANSLVDPGEVDSDVARFWTLEHSGIVGDLREKWI